MVSRANGIISLFEDPVPNCPVSAHPKQQTLLFSMNYFEISMNFLYLIVRTHYDKAMSTPASHIPSSDSL